MSTPRLTSQMLLTAALVAWAGAAEAQPLRSGRPAARPAPATQREPQPHAEALQDLARRSGKVVVWVGSPPRTASSPGKENGSIAGLAQGYAQKWGATLLCTPDAIFFLAAGAFAHVRPAHFDPDLPVHHTVPLLNRLPDALLARFPSTTELPAPDTEALREALSLAEIEAACPGFEAQLRELLRRARARVGGRQSGAAKLLPDEILLHNVPRERLYVRLLGNVTAVCSVDKHHTALPLPLSLARLPLGEGLGRSAGAGTETPRHGVRQVVTTLGKLIRDPRYVSGATAGAKVVVDHRLNAIPVVISVPAPAEVRDLWPLLQPGIGVERRVLGDTIFFGPWNTAERETRFAFLARWARARGDLWLTLFTPGMLQPRSVPAGELDPRLADLLVSELSSHRSHGDKALSRFTDRELRTRGRVMVTQFERLEVIYVSETADDGAPKPLDRYRFLLR